MGEAIKLGSTAIGIRTDEGCVLACEKRLTSSLMEPTTIEKIVEVDKHLATAYSGLAADSKILIEKARVESQNFWFSHDSNIRVESAIQAVSNLAIQFGDSDGGDEAGALSRPFGVALLMARMDLNSSTWIRLGPMSSSTPRPSGPDLRAPSSL